MSDRPAGRPGDGAPRRTVRERVERWLLVEGSRWAVTAGVMLSVFASVVLLGGVDPSPLRAVLTASDPIETLFQAYVTAIVTGVTLVVTINQLVLSQELGAVGDQRSRMEGALEFRDDVEDALDADALSPHPAAFLRALVDGSAARAADLAAATEAVDGAARDDVDSYVRDLTASAEEVAEQLEGARFGTFAVLSAALDFEYSRELHRGRRLGAAHDDALSEEARSALDRLVETLALFGPAREHFKTLYFQWELINLSRAILYASVPAIVVTSAAILYLDAGAVTGALLGVDSLVWIVSAGTTVALSPFALLLSYVLRIATVAKRTLAIGPFVLEDGDRAYPPEAGNSSKDSRETT